MSPARWPWCLVVGAIGACSPGERPRTLVDAGVQADVEPPFVPVASCAPALELKTSPVRSSSLRQGNCDYGEVEHFGCRRACADDRLCATGERCQPVEYHTDYIPFPRDWVCECAGASCPQRGPDGLPREPEGGLELWARGPSLPTDLYDHAAAASPRWLFVGGGQRILKVFPNGSDTETVATVYAGQLDAGGAVSAWSTAGTLPAPRSAHGLAVHGDRLYLVGGREMADYTGEVWSAVIGSDGALGPWRQEPPLPGPRGGHRTLVWGDWLIVVGGTPALSKGGVREIWLAPFGADGRLGDWTSRLAPHSVYQDGGAGVALDRLYILDIQGTLHSAPLPALDDWRQDAMLPATRVFAFEKPVMVSEPGMGPVHLWELCGALVALVRGGNVLTAPLDAAGRVGPWRIASRFYGPWSGYASAATGDAIYALAGSNGVTPVVPIDAVWSVHRQR